MTKNYAKKMVLRVAAKILADRERGLLAWDGLFAIPGTCGDRVPEEDAIRLFNAIDEVIAELQKRGNRGLTA